MNHKETIIVSILVDVIVTTCNNDSLATSQSLNRTRSAPRKSCFASKQVCPKGSFLFGTLKVTLHFIHIWLSNLPYSSTQIFPIYFNTAFPSLCNTACRVRRRFVKAAAKITAAESLRDPWSNRRGRRHRNRNFEAPGVLGCRVPKFRRRTRKEKRAAAKASWIHKNLGKWQQWPGESNRLQGARHGCYQVESFSPWCGPNPSNTRPAATFHPMHWDVLVPGSAHSTGMPWGKKKWTGERLQFVIVFFISN